MLARLRHGIRMGLGFAAVVLLAACGRDATRPETARLPAAAPVPVPPAPDLPVLADLATTVYFDYKRSSLRPGARRAIEKWAAFLKVNGDLVVRLIGHTDDSGSPDENHALGERRALAVRRALVRGGIAKHRIEVLSRGEEDPQVYGNDEFSASRNRRVEFEVSRPG